MMNNKDVKLHLMDILEECKSINDIESTNQIIHNVFEIAEHLGISDLK